MAQGLRDAVPSTAVHLCVDMQRMFVEDTDWRTPWAARVLPVIERLCEAKPERNIFTRFIPAARPGEGRGTWRGYWERWSSMTLEALGADMVDLATPLQRFVPPGRLIDKRGYSPWFGTDLDSVLRRSGVDTLVVTGADCFDVCPKGAVVAVNGARPKELLIVPAGADLLEVKARLGLQDHRRVRAPLGLV